MPNDKYIRSGLLPDVLLDHDTSELEVLLRVDGLSKSYVSRDYKSLLGLKPAVCTQALDGISFALRGGEVTALLGPNGAGKTTLVNIFCDLIRADAGRVMLAGYQVPAQGRAARRQIGYVTTNDRSFFWRLSGRRNLEFFAALSGYGATEARERSAQVLERFRLTAHADKLFHTYSAGMKKRLGLARAFLHAPAVLLLDEPTNGLDAVSTEELIELVNSEIRSSGKTVLWATHRAEEIERLCDRVLVLIGGRLRFDGPTQDFLDISKRHMNFTIRVIPPTDGSILRDMLPELGLALSESVACGSVDLRGVGGERQLSSVLTRILSAGAMVQQIERHPEPLHLVFSHLESLHTRPPKGPTTTAVAPETQEASHA
jgi:ABC-2 type transport system ATP-binding protein